MARSAARLAAAAVGLLLTVAPARADLLWTYNVTPSVTSVASDGNPGSKILLSNEPLVPVVNNTDIVLTNLTTVSSTNPQTPDSFTASGAYSASVLITDTASGKSTTVVLSGKLSGTLSSLSANITHAFTGTTSYTFVLGDNEYTVTAGLYSQPGPPNASNRGSISAHVEVHPYDGGDPQKTPEPSSLLLAGLGFAGLAARWRRRRVAV